jgi:hypothetical protein
MKTWTTMVAMMVMALLVGVAQAEEKKPDGEKRKMNAVAGAITAVDATSITVQPGDAAKPAVTAALTEKTKVKIDGAEAKLADLKVGQKVRVALSEDGKTALAVTSAPAAKHKEGAK